jgi:hypothetical protein
MTGRCRFAKKLFSEEVFRAGRLVFLTIVLGPRGTAVFLDGALVRQAPPQVFPLSIQACSGDLWLAIRRETIIPGTESFMGWRFTNGRFRRGDD